MVLQTCPDMETADQKLQITLDNKHIYWTKSFFAKYMRFSNGKLLLRLGFSVVRLNSKLSPNCIFFQRTQKIYYEKCFIVEMEHF